MSPTTQAEPHVLTEPAPTEAVRSVRTRLSDNVPVTFGDKLRDTIRYTRGRGALEIGIIFAAILLSFIIAGAVAPASFPFLDPANVSAVLSQSIPVLAILGIGAGILMIAGEFDLSVGASIGFCSIVFIRMSNTYGWGIGLVLALGAGVLIAVINGFIVVYTRIPSFIATLGMAFFWTGASLFINGTTPAILLDSTTVGNIFAGALGPIHTQILWMAGIGLVAWFFLHRHKRGNHVFAVGGNAAAAKAISIRPGAVKILSFGILGFLVAFSAVLISAQTTSMQPGTTEPYTLLAVAAAVVGGCSLTGGRGSVIGMVIGAALIEVVQDGLILGRAPGFYIQVFVGLIIVVAAIFNKLMEGKAS